MPSDVLLIAAAFALVASTVVAVAAMGIAARTTRIIVGGIVLASQMQLSVLVCGSFGVLEPGPLLAVQVAVSAIVVGLAAANHGLDQLPRPSSWVRLHPRVRSGSTVPGAFAAADEADPAAPGLRERLGAATRWVRRHPWHVATAAVVGLLYAWHLALAVALPATDYDGLALHGTAVAHWVTTGGFGASGLSPMVDAAPLGPAAISAWTATFTSDLNWMFLTQLGFAVLGAAAVADLAARFGAGRADSALAGAVFAGLPVVALQATSGYPDLAAASSVLAAWCLGLGLAHRGTVWHRATTLAGRREDRRDLALMGLALGLAVSARPANLGIAVLVLGVGIALPAAIALRRSLDAGGTGDTVDIGALLRRGAVLLVPLVVLGGSWYLRNALDHGNPLYPFSFGPLQGLGSVDRLIVAPNRPEVLTDVGGRVAQTVTSWIADLSPSTYAVDQRLGGFGPIFPLLLLPATVVLLLSERRTDIRATAAMAAATLVVVPTPWWSRGTLIVPAVGAAALGAVLARAGARRRLALLAATLVLTAVGAGFTVRTSPYVSGETHRHAGLVEAFDLARARDRSAVVPYDRYQWLDAHHPHGTVGVIRGAVPSLRVPIYGSTLQRRVVVLEPAADPDALARSMRAAHADVVLVPDQSEDLLDQIDDDGPLAVAATGIDAPTGLSIVSLR